MFCRTSAARVKKEKRKACHILDISLRCHDGRSWMWLSPVQWQSKCPIGSAALVWWTGCVGLGVRKVDVLANYRAGAETIRGLACVAADGEAHDDAGDVSTGGEGYIGTNDQRNRTYGIPPACVPSRDGLHAVPALAESSEARSERAAIHGGQVVPHRHVRCPRQPGNGSPLCVQSQC